MPKLLRYASAAEARRRLEKTSRLYRIDRRVEVVSRLNNQVIFGADIVTNSRALRPLNKYFVAAMRKRR